MLVSLPSPGKQECIAVKAFVLPASQTQNMLNPIEFRLSYEIDDDRSPNEPFCANCPVLYAKEPVTATTAYKVLLLSGKYVGMSITLGYSM